MTAFMMIGNVACDTQHQAEEAIDGLVQEYIQKTHCGDKPCETCDVGAAHADEEGNTGLTTIDAAFNAGAKVVREEFEKDGVYVVLTGYGSATPDVQFVSTDPEAVLKLIKAWEDAYDFKSDVDMLRMINQPGGNMFGRHTFVKKMLVNPK